MTTPATAGIAPLDTGATHRTIRGNLAWAFGYNIAMVPLAALGLLDPLIASAAMTLSSAFVVWNSLRLQRCPIQPAPGRRPGRTGSRARPARMTPSTGTTVPPQAQQGHERQRAVTSRPQVFPAGRPRLPGRGNGRRVAARPFPAPSYTGKEYPGVPGDK